MVNKKSKAISVPWENPQNEITEGTWQLKQGKEKVYFTKKKGSFTIQREEDRKLLVSASQARLTYSLLIEKGYKKRK